MASVPDVPRGPLQPPDAVQLVALVLFQLSVVPLPAVTLSGVPESVTIGCAAGAGAGTGVLGVSLLPPLPPPQPESCNAAMSNTYRSCRRENRSMSMIEYLPCVRSRLRRAALALQVTHAFAIAPGHSQGEQCQRQPIHRAAALALLG